jgi:hypothetical protein
MKALVTSSRIEVTDLAKHISLIIDIKISQFNGHELFYVLYVE